MAILPPEPVRRLLVVIPNWVGDVVLCTPTLAALRAHFRAARITYLLRNYVAEVVAGGGWHDEEMHWATGKPAAVREIRNLRVARQARRAAFDAALLLTNSFRAAAFARMAGATRRIGFARDGRGWLLTDKLRPLRADGRFVPTSVVDSYAAVAEHVGCLVSARKPRLGITAEQEQAGASLQRHYRLTGRTAKDAGPSRRYAVINPGAAFGAAKCWLPERFAQVCDGLRDQHDLVSVIVGGGSEAPLMREIAERAASRPICVLDPGTTLGSLKVLIRDAALLVCNDTGPRHYGIALDVPTLTIFGPTHQAWTAVHAPRELRLQAHVECGPCQLRTCPLDHRCMKAITHEMVMNGAAGLLATEGRVALRAPA